MLVFDAFELVDAIDFFDLFDIIDLFECKDLFDLADVFDLIDTGVDGLTGVVLFDWDSIASFDCPENFWLIFLIE